MNIVVQSFWLSKAGNTRGEYEDSFDFSYNRRRWTKVCSRPTFLAVERDMRQPRFAVADGATESSFSGEWARLLVRSYVHHGPRTPRTLLRIVDECSAQWTREVMTKPLSWFAEDKARQGSFATLVGLSLSPGAESRLGGRWTALAVGDSCLFQVREGQLASAFPLERADLFGYHPLLLSTIPERNQAVWEQPSKLRKTGDWQNGDLFLLMTDALAQWFLSEVERGGQPWETLRNLAQPAQMLLPAPFSFETAPNKMMKSGAQHTELLEKQFIKWVDERRTDDSMHNDDLTLLMLTVGGESHETTAIH